MTVKEWAEAIVAKTKDTNNLEMFKRMGLAFHFNRSDSLGLITYFYENFFIDFKKQLNTYEDNQINNRIINNLIENAKFFLEECVKAYNNFNAEIDKYYISQELWALYSNLFLNTIDNFKKYINKYSKGE